MKSFTDNSIKNMVFDAGVIYFNIVKADFEAFLAGEVLNTFESVFLDSKKLGATTGGNTLSIVQEYREIEVDGKFGKVKGLTILSFSDASLSTSLKELSAANIAKVLNNGDGSIVVGDYNKITVKECLDASDYIDNIVLISPRYCEGGTTEFVFVLLENVINTNGLELALEDNNEGTIELVFESHKTVNDRAAQVEIYTVIPL